VIRIKQSAVIFDLDGVIVDSEPFHCDAWINTFREKEVEIDNDYYFRKLCGNHHSITVNTINTEFKKDIHPEWAAFRKSFHASELARGRIEPLPFVVALIKELHDKGVRLAVASSSSHRFVKSVLTTIGLEGYFSVIHSAESVKNGKPAPDIYLKTAKILNVRPQNVIAIEDTRTGIQSAKKAGMKCIGFLNGRNTMDALQYSDFVINSFETLNYDMIRKILKNNK